jgi:hypothetical protein
MNAALGPSDESSPSASLDNEEEDDRFEDARHNLSPLPSPPQSEESHSLERSNQFPPLAVIHETPAPTYGHASVKNLRVAARLRRLANDQIQEQPRRPRNPQSVASSNTKAYNIWGFPTIQTKSDEDAYVSPQVGV